jgi:hypothetical protein
MAGKKYVVVHTMINAGPTIWREGGVVDASDFALHGVDVKRLRDLGAIRNATAADLAAPAEAAAPATDTGGGEDGQ